MLPFVILIGGDAHLSTRRWNVYQKQPIELSIFSLMTYYIKNQINEKNL